MSELELELTYVVLDEKDVIQTMLDEAVGKADDIAKSADGEQIILKFHGKYPNSMGGRKKYTLDGIHQYMEDNSDFEGYGAPPESEYFVHNLEEIGSITYVGEMDRSGIWMVRKITEDNGSTNILYANKCINSSTEDYATAWATRANLTYDVVANLGDIHR